VREQCFLGLEVPVMQLISRRKGMGVERKRKRERERERERESESGMEVEARRARSVLGAHPKSESQYQNIRKNATQKESS
jgi:hypothetical protein